MTPVGLVPVSLVPVGLAPAAPPDRATIGSGFFALVATAWALYASAAFAPVDARVVYLADVPRPGWYEADNLAVAARAAGATPPLRASGPVADGATVRLHAGWALPDRTPEAAVTRAFGGRVSLNHASIAALEGLPGIGPTLAARIFAGRPYRTTAELDRVRGIGPKKLAALTSLVAP